jgi:hypothetical protein
MTSGQFHCDGFHETENAAGSVTDSADQTRAILAAYQQVMTASWPDLHPEMAARSASWPSATDEALKEELRSYLRAASRPDCTVRVFWKLTPDYTFGGCNEHFARDAGLTVTDLVGRDDFDRKLPWVFQAAKYRADDEAIVRSGHAKLDIIERQKGASGTITWVRVGKAPIRTAARVIGVLGMYEMLDPETGHRLFAKRSGRG